MIKINLLPKEYALKDAAQQKIMLVVFAAILVLSVFFGGYVLKVVKLSTLNKKVQHVDRELKKLQPIIDKVNAIQQKKSDLNTKINVILNLMKARVLYPKFMEDIAEIIPSKVWLTAINTKSSSNMLQVNLNINAMDNYAVAEMITVFEKSEKFNNVQTSGKTLDNKSFNGVTTINVSGVDVKNFMISCEYSPGGAEAVEEKKIIKKKKPRRRR